MKDDRLYLIHIQECIARIQAYAKDGREVFLKTSLIQDAVIRNLQILAESTRRLSEPLKGRHPEANWRGIWGFRNVVVHDYLGVDLESIWDIIEKDIPILRRHIETILKSLPKQN